MVVGLELLCRDPDSRDWYCSGGKTSHGRQVYLFAESGYIFASYSHKNMKEVFSVIKKLADARYRIWYDEGIEPGNEWPEEVGKALTGCQLFVVFMSPAAMESRNVRNEINFASGENKSVMVVNLQPAELSEGMKLQIGTVQFINKQEMSESDFIEKMKRVLDPVLRL